MSDFLLSLLIIAFIALLIRLWLRKRDREHKTRLPLDFEAFEAAVRRNDIPEIKRIGELVVYNTSLNKKQLERLREVIDERLRNYPDLAELEQAIMNKELHFNRYYHSSY